MAQRLRNLGPRVLGWGAAAAVFAVSSAAFLEDVMGPERHTLNATLGPLFTWLGPGKDTLTWRVLSSPWALGVLAIAGFAVYLRHDSRMSSGRGRGIVAGTLTGILAVAWVSDALVRSYLPGVFRPMDLPVPYLPAIGLYLLEYRRAFGWRRAVALIPGALASTAIVLRFVADGRLDPASAVLSLLWGAFMFCMTMSALSAMSLPGRPAAKES